MMKIKVKKELDLVELIQWGFKNNIKNKHFFSSNTGTVQFNELGGVSVNAIRQDTTFTVEVEKEITEETEISRLIHVYKEGNDALALMWTNSTIKEINATAIDIGYTSTAFYMLNDDLSMTLLWRNGEMVE